MKGKECCYWNRYIIQSKEKEKVEMMLVELAGIKMFYPTNYICLLADEISTDEAKPVDMNDNLSRENRVKSLNGMLYHLCFNSAIFSANHRKDPSGSYFVSKIFIDAVLPENSYSNNIQILDYRRSSDCTCELCNPKENIEQITKPIGIAGFHFYLI